MTSYSNQLPEFALTLPITQMANTRAQRFASEQPTPEKVEQVRVNTLAVCVVNDYLQMMGIPTNLSGGDSWNPVMRMFADVADLELPGVGRLECRPYTGDQSTCHIPPEVWSDRIGYLVVEIDESAFEATVWGFVPSVATEELSVNQLQPVEDLIAHYHQLIEPVAEETPAVSQRTKVNLSQWLTDVFETGWQTVETLLNSGEPELAFSFRSPVSSVEIEEDQQEATLVRRAKLVDLGMLLAGHPVALIVELRPESEQKREIIIQVHPTGNQVYLPSLLKLTVLDESGLIFLETQARSADNYIQLQFSGLVGEQFSVEVALGDASITEDFAV
ncbi:DUF1822 family protein [Lyngbya aestuarii]|uniref:DUF1822 family protein n=1 Tax=Lyngbya aestuarii TaxID=118322 RepID=UPI00403DE12D